MAKFKSGGKQFYNLKISINFERQIWIFTYDVLTILI
jgi:hypothetical protein